MSAVTETAGRLLERLDRYDCRVMRDLAVCWSQALTGARTARWQGGAAYWQDMAGRVRRELAQRRQFGPYIPPYMRQRQDGTWFNANWEC